MWVLSKRAALPRPRAPLPDTLLWATADAFLVTIPRPGYLQCGLLIAKGTIDTVRAAGLDAFRARIASAAPRLAEVASRLDSWDDVKLLTVSAPLVNVALSVATFVRSNSPFAKLTEVTGIVTAGTAGSLAMLGATVGLPLPETFAMITPTAPLSCAL